jgi:hypothetical protein
MVAEARRDPAWAVLGSIPFLGPVRVALILAIMRTPWRFRTKRNLWAYCGLAVVTHSSSDYELVDGQVVRRRRAPMTRGLNRNYSRELKDVFKGAATAATGRPGPLLDFYEGMVARGMREELARVTLTRKLTALTLRTRPRFGAFPPPAAPGPGTEGAGGSLKRAVRPATSPPRHSPNHRPPAGPEEASGRPQRPSLR